MNKETAPHLTAGDTLALVNRAMETKIRRLYEVDRPQLTKAVFVEKMETDPEALSMWFNLIEEAAESDAETAKSMLLRKVGGAEWKISSFMNMLPFEEQQKLDTRIKEMNKTISRSRNGLVGALIRHHVITNEMIGSNGVINIPEDQRTGLLAHAHNFRLSERSVNRIEKLKKDAAAPVEIFDILQPVPVSESIPDELTPVESGMKGFLKTLIRSRNKSGSDPSVGLGNPRPAPEAG
jgi:hypothetical protein